MVLNLGDSVSMEFVRVPEGDFLMGSELPPAQSDTDEHPRHRVHVKPFYMGKSEVTVAQFRRFVDETGYRTDAERGTPVPEKSNMKDGVLGGPTVDETGNWVLNTNITWRDPELPQSENHPVVVVSWNDAQVFCSWLSNKTSRRVRLPTEAEWEYACLGGTTTHYWWGDEPDTSGKVANLADLQAKRRYELWESIGMDFLDTDDGFLYAAPVGSYRANPFGLYDMIGNVWEWCEDTKQPSYKGAPSDGSAWTEPCEHDRRVFRGGTWGNGARQSRCSWRAGHSAGCRGTSFGFRVVVEVPANHVEAAGLAQTMTAAVNP